MYSELNLHADQNRFQYFLKFSPGTNYFYSKLNIGFMFVDSSEHFFIYSIRLSYYLAFYKRVDDLNK